MRLGGTRRIDPAIGAPGRCEVFTVLRWRLVSASIIVAISVSLVAADYWLAESTERAGLVLVPLALIVTWIASGEVRRLFENKGHQPRRWVTEFGATLVMAISAVPVLWSQYPENCPVGRIGWVELGLLAALAWYAVVEMWRYREPEKVIERLAIQSFCALYVGGLMGCLVTLRVGPGNAWGTVALVHTIAIVKLADTGAYGFGKTLGKRKLTPVLSPGKTVEGAIGALVVGGLAGWLVTELLTWLVFGQVGLVPAWKGLVLGLVLSIVGMLGDLLESLLKRDSGIKDSSSWMPGLGGILDVVDSLLAVTPVAALAWTAWMIESVPAVTAE